MNKRFPVLSSFSWVLRVIGWLVLGGGLLSSVNQAIRYFKAMPHVILNLPWLIQNVTLIIVGTVVIVLGEIIGVLFSIEQNTHLMAQRNISTTSEQRGQDIK